MTHLHKASGKNFECGTLVDTSDNTTYDITVISYWYEDDCNLLSPILINYYFGEYDPQTTDYYIDQWLKNVSDCKDIVDAYWTTNEDVLEGSWLFKARRVRMLFESFGDLLQSK